MYPVIIPGQEKIILLNRVISNMELSLNDLREYLFVYGTLRKDYRPRKIIEFDLYSKFYSTGLFKGCLFDVGRYPAVVYSERNTYVEGDVFILSPGGKLLDILDEYEEVDNEKPWAGTYIRKKTEIKLGENHSITAWIYIYNRPVNKLIKIKSGNYLEYIANK